MPSTVTVVSGGNVMQLYDAIPAGTPKGAVLDWLGAHLAKG